jgi:hypothetical protein
VPWTLSSPLAPGSDNRGKLPALLIDALDGGDPAPLAGVLGMSESGRPGVRARRMSTRSSARAIQAQFEPLPENRSSH